MPHPFSPPSPLASWWYSLKLPTPSSISSFPSPSTLSFPTSSPKSSHPQALALTLSSLPLGLYLSCFTSLVVPLATGYLRNISQSLIRFSDLFARQYHNKLTKIWLMCSHYSVHLCRILWPQKLFLISFWKLYRENYKNLSRKPRKEICLKG